MGSALARFGHSLARVKIWKCSTPQGPKDGVSKNALWVVRFNIEISKVTGRNFTGLVSANAAGIAVDGIKIRL